MFYKNCHDQKDVLGKLCCYTGKEVVIPLFFFFVCFCFLIIIIIFYCICIVFILLFFIVVDFVIH